MSLSCARCRCRTLEHNHNSVVQIYDDRVNVRTLVGSGHAVADTRIVIVDPQSLTACASDEVGEIWVSAPSVAQGYWNRPEETELTFHAYLAEKEKVRFCAPEIWDSSAMASCSSPGA